MERKSRLADNLNAYRIVHHLSLEKFALKLKIPKTTLQSAISSRNATLYTLVRIANALNCSLDELVFGQFPDAKLL